MPQNAAKMTLFRSSNLPRGIDPKPTFTPNTSDFSKKPRRLARTCIYPLSTLKALNTETALLRQTSTEQLTARYQGPWKNNKSSPRNFQFSCVPRARQVLNRHRTSDCHIPGARRKYWLKSSRRKSNFCISRATQTPNQWRPDTRGV